MPVSSAVPSVSIDDLRKFVNAGDEDNVNATLERCFRFGQALVARFTENATTVIPSDVLDEAVLTAAADQWNRRSAPNGIVNQQYAGPDGAIATPIRISRDPFASIRPMLNPWVNSGSSSIRLTTAATALP